VDRPLACRSLLSKQCSVEEADDALLVLTRSRLEAAGLMRLRDLPERLRGVRGPVVVEVGFLAASAVAGVDEEDVPRCDPGDEVVQASDRGGFDPRVTSTSFEERRGLWSIRYGTVHARSVSVGDAEWSARRSSSREWIASFR
jgi:hypothetical protein